MTSVKKVSEGHPNVEDLVEQGALQLVLNTPLGARAYDDNRAMRAAAVRRGVPLLTTLSAAAAAVNGIAALKSKELSVRSLQEHYRQSRAEKNGRSPH